MRAGGRGGRGGRGAGARAAASSSTDDDDDKYPNLSWLGISDEKLVEHLHQPRPPSPTLKDFSRYGDDDPFRFEQEWIYLPDAWTGNLAPFFKSAVGREYVYYVDQMMDGMRHESRQEVQYSPPRKYPMVKYETTWRLFRDGLRQVSNQFVARWKQSEVFWGMPQASGRQHKNPWRDEDGHVAEWAAKRERNWDHIQEELDRMVEWFEQHPSGPHDPSAVPRLRGSLEYDSDEEAAEFQRRAAANDAWFREARERRLANADKIDQVEKGSLAFLSQYDELLNLMTQRYAMMDLGAAVGRTVDPIRTFVGWDSLLPDKRSATTDESMLNFFMQLASARSSDDDDARTRGLYIVDGSNCFYEHEPTKWAKNLKINRHGECGPVIVFMKEDTYYKTAGSPTWARGAASVYNALQELHGGHPVYLVVCVVELLSSGTGKFPCMDIKKRPKKNNPNRIESVGLVMLDPQTHFQNYAPLKPGYNHMLCEYDDVAVVRFHEEFNGRSSSVGGNSNATFVTHERPQTFVKNTREMESIGKMMLKLGDNMRFDVYALI